MKTEELKIGNNESIYDFHQRELKQAELKGRTEAIEEIIEMLDEIKICKEDENKTISGVAHNQMIEELKQELEEKK